MRGTLAACPCPVAPCAARIGKPARLDIYALLVIHLMSATSAKQQAGKNINLRCFCRAVAGSNPLLRKFKGFLVNKRLMGVWEEIALFFFVLPGLFRLVGYLVSFRGYGMP